MNPDSKPRTRSVWPSSWFIRSSYLYSCTASWESECGVGHGNCLL